MSTGSDKDFLKSVMGEAIRSISEDEPDMDAYVANGIANGDGAAVRKAKPKAAPKAPPPEEEPPPKPFRRISDQGSPT
jgi:hypothetical protein